MQFATSRKCLALAIDHRQPVDAQNIPRRDFGHSMKMPGIGAMGVCFTV
jgi:hypothetical protein